MTEEVREFFKVNVASIMSQTEALAFMGDAVIALLDEVYELQKRLDTVQQQANYAYSMVSPIGG